MVPAVLWIVFARALALACTGGTKNQKHWHTFVAPAVLWIVFAHALALALMDG
jgi:hypothetical protein